MFDFSQARGFIFDCDGTLLDSLGAWEQAEAPLFAEAGELTLEQEDELHAAPFDECARMFHEKYGVGESSRAVWEHLEGFLLPFYRDRACALPGAVEFVRAAHEQGIPCVVLSSSPVRYLRAGLERAGIAECFVELISTEDLGVSKQDAAIYEHAVETLGADAGEIWCVDDAPYAIKVMHDFGFKTIAPVNGAGAERIARYGENADIVTETLADLLA